MSARLAAVVPLLALVAIVALRFEAIPFAIAVGAAGAIVVLAWFAGRRAGERAHVPACLTLLLATLTAAAGLVPDAWPCDVACRAGEEWATLFGVPTLAWAAGATLLAALLVALGRGATRSRWLTLPGEVVVSAGAGASLFFLALAVRLAMPCRHCVATHLPLLAAAALLATTTPSFRWLRRLALIAGALLTRQLFQIDLERSVSQPPPLAAVVEPAPAAAPRTDTTAAAASNAPATMPAEVPVTAPAATPAEDAALLATLERGRRFGGVAPKLRVEVIFSFNCGHCMQEFEPLIDTLKPLCSDGQAELVLHLLHAKKDAASRELSKLAFAAGREGRLRERVVATFAVRADAVAPRGARSGNMQTAVSRYFARDALTLEQLLLAPDVAADAAFIKAHAPLFERFLEAEEASQRRLGGSGEMPWFFLVDPAAGALLEALPEHTTVAQLAAAVKRRLR